MVTLSSEYATDRCAELSPPFKGSLLGTLCLVRSRVRAEMHDLCVWLWRASCGAAFRSWHGGHFRWPVLLTAALSCRHYRASLRHVGQICVWGFSIVFGYFVFGSLVRQSRSYARRVPVALVARARAAFTSWRMVTLSSEYAADRCAELSPFPGLAGYFVLGMLSRQG